jgi:hypothetical protein
VELMITVYSLVKGPPYIGAKLSALASLWRERSIIKERRARYQPLRKISDFRLLRSLKLTVEWRQLFHTVV